MSAVVEQVAVDLARQREVVAALRAFLPAASLLFDHEDVKPYECDGLTAYRQVPMVVALPETEDQVCRILKTCHAAQGAGGRARRGHGALRRRAAARQRRAALPREIHAHRRNR